MKKVMYIILVAAIPFLSACATSGNKDIASPDKLNQLKKGSTTQQEVLTSYGPPQVKTNLDTGGEKWEYAFVDYQMKGATFIPFVGLFAGGSNSNVNTLELTFDQKQVLQSITSGAGTVETTNFQGGETHIQKQEH